MHSAPFFCPSAAAFSPPGSARVSPAFFLRTGCPHLGRWQHLAPTTVKTGGKSDTDLNAYIDLPDFYPKAKPSFIRMMLMYIDLYPGERVCAMPRHTQFSAGNPGKTCINIV